MVQNFSVGILENSSERIRNTEKEALLEAKEENQKYRSEIESELKESRLELKSQENRLIQREQTLDRKDDSLEKREGSLEEKKLGAGQQLVMSEKRSRNLINQQHQELERIASFQRRSKIDYYEVNRRRVES